MAHIKETLESITAVNQNSVTWWKHSDIKHKFMKTLSSTTYWTYKYIKMIKYKTEEQSLSVLYKTGISRDI
jgi:hypothetical protein